MEISCGAELGAESLSQSLFTKLFLIRLDCVYRFCLIGCVWLKLGSRGP